MQYIIDRVDNSHDVDAVSIYLVRSKASNKIDYQYLVVAFAAILSDPILKV